MYSYGSPHMAAQKQGRPARTYIQQLCEDTGCCPEDLPRAMNDREEWRERVRDIRATSAIWWWWWYLERCKQEHNRNIFHKIATNFFFFFFQVLRLILEFCKDSSYKLLMYQLYKTWTICQIWRFKYITFPLFSWKMHLIFNRYIFDLI